MEDKPETGFSVKIDPSALELTKDFVDNAVQLQKEGRDLSALKRPSRDTSAAGQVQIFETAVTLAVENSAPPIEPLITMQDGVPTVTGDVPEALTTPLEAQPPKFAFADKTTPDTPRQTPPVDGHGDDGRGGR